MDHIFQYGEENIELKLNNLKEIDVKPPSLFAYHNKFYSQIRDAYIIGSYYPALTGAASLGERILNQLLLSLRSYYSHTREYRAVYRKNSFDNWDTAINTLEAWNVLQPKALEAFKELKTLRNNSIHFNFSTESTVKEDAISGINLITTIIDTQFGSYYNGQDWYIPGIEGGAAFIKKEYEENPFVKEILIPNSELVGYKHKMVRSGNELVPEDIFEYEEKEITDEEFRDLYIQEITKK